MVVLESMSRYAVAFEPSLDFPSHFKSEPADFSGIIIHGTGIYLCAKGEVVSSPYGDSLSFSLAHLEKKGFLPEGAGRNLGIAVLKGDTQAIENHLASLDSDSLVNVILSELDAACGWDYQTYATDVRQALSQEELVTIESSPEVASFYQEVSAAEEKKNLWKSNGMRPEAQAYIDKVSQEIGIEVETVSDFKAKARGFSTVVKSMNPMYAAKRMGLILTATACSLEKASAQGSGTGAGGPGFAAVLTTCLRTLPAKSDVELGIHIADQQRQTNTIVQGSFSGAMSDARTLWDVGNYFKQTIIDRFNSLYSNIMTACSTVEEQNKSVALLTKEICEMMQQFSDRHDYKRNAQVQTLLTQLSQHPPSSLVDLLQQCQIVSRQLVVDEMHSYSSYESFGKDSLTYRERVDTLVTIMKKSQTLLDKIENEFDLKDRVSEDSTAIGSSRTFSFDSNSSVRTLEPHNPSDSNSGGRFEGP